MEPSGDQYYVLCLATTRNAPRLIRAWKRRRWIEHCFRTLKHLLAKPCHQFVYTSADSSRLYRSDISPEISTQLFTHLRSVFYLYAAYSAR